MAVLDVPVGELGCGAQGVVGESSTVKLHFEAETTKFDNFIGPERLPGGDY